MAFSSMPKTLLTKEIIHLLLDDFFSSEQNLARFLKEFPQMPYCRKVEKGSYLQNIREGKSLVRRRLLDCCLEYPDILPGLASLRSSNGFGKKTKVTKKNLKRFLKTCSIVELVWKGLSKDVVITEGAWSELVLELGKLRSKSGTSRQLSPKETIKKITAENSKLVEKCDLLRRQNKNLKKENRSIKAKVIKLERELKKINAQLEKKASRFQRKQSENGGQRGDDFCSLKFKFARALLTKLQGELEEFEKSRKKLIEELTVLSEKAEEKLRKSEAQICCYGQVKLVIVDGHNLVFRSFENGSNFKKYAREPEARHLVEESLRWETILNLIFAARRLNSKIEVFFDTPYKEAKEVYEDLTVFYCPKYRGGADYFITLRMNEIKDGQNVLVFSSDRKHIKRKAVGLKQQGKVVPCLSVEILGDYLVALREFWDKSWQLRKVIGYPEPANIY